jgi:high-affinity Fe2+/Pb2+ permease
MNQNYYKYIQIFVYGVITPSIICVGIYYTFTNAFKESLKSALKDALQETIDNSIKKHIKETIGKFRS